MVSFTLALGSANNWLQSQHGSRASGMMVQQFNCEVWRCSPRCKAAAVEAVLSRPGAPSVSIAGSRWFGPEPETLLCRFISATNFK